MMAHLWVLDLVFTHYFHILLRRVPILVFTSIYPSVNYTGLLVIVLFLTFILPSSVSTPKNSGLELLGSPIWGPPQFYNAFLSVQFDKIVAIQDKLVDLEDPQVELHLFRSCLSVCKVTHLLRCVPSSSLGSFPSHFDLRFLLFFSRGNQNPLPPPLALDVEMLDKNWTEIKGSNLNN